MSIDDETGGHRVTPSKCCGRWEVVKTWPLSADEWRSLAAEATRAAEDLDEDADSDPSETLKDA